MIKTETQIRTNIDADGNETTSITEKTTNIQKSAEPDYIKVYTKMWCEFNCIPETYRDLFMELACRMTYCNTADLGHSQLVNTGGPWADDIMSKLRWKRAMYQRGLSELCKCNAIKKISRGVYQINPEYAGRGEWKYNPKLERGGLEDLVATFKFKDGKVDTKITWANNPNDDSDLSNMYRQGMDIKQNDNFTLKTVKKTRNTPNRTDTNDNQIPGQEEIDSLFEVSVNA